MGFKKFVVKQALKLKGVSGDQAELIAERLSSDPALAESMKALEGNKEVTDLFKKIQDEIEEKKKTMPEQYAAMAVMTKYKAQIAKHRDELAPLMQLFMGAK